MRVRPLSMREENGQGIQNGLRIVEPQLMHHLGRDLLQVLFVSSRQEHVRHLVAMRGKDLFLHAPDGQNAARQGDLTGGESNGGAGIQRREVNDRDNAVVVD